MVTPPDGTSLLSDGEHLELLTPIKGGLVLYNPLWETDAEDAGGWTWEARLKIPHSSNSTGLHLRIGDAQIGDNRPHLGLKLLPNRLLGFKGTELIKADFTSEFVTLRIAQQPSEDRFLIWRDGNPLEVELSDELLTDEGRSWIGEGSSGTAGAAVIDYIRWTGSGAFAPSAHEPGAGLRDSVAPTRSINRGSSDATSVESQPSDYRSTPREIPDFGLMLNDDADVSFPSSDPELAKRYRQAMIDVLAGTPVKTLMYSLGMGSDTLYYSTSAGSELGWRKTKYDKHTDSPKNEEQMWAQRMQNIANGIRAGVDPVRVSGEKAKQLGMYFVPSYRMNDDHFMFDPLQYPMTGEFWLKNHQRLKLRDSPVLSDPSYGQLLDYSHAEVRDYRLGIIYEAIERYQDIMDGFELDFNRVQVFFPYQKAEERAHLMTDVVAKVRKRLDELGKRKQRDYWLFVRVPPTLENSRWSGLDLATWLERNLVDVVIPAQLMTLAHDMPVKEFVELAEPHGAKVFPSIYPRTAFTWPIPTSATSSSYKAASSRFATQELFRGAAANYWNDGASGFQLFNFRTVEIPFSDVHYRIIRDLAVPEALRLANKTFAITPSYYFDYEGTYQYRKQLPLDLEVGATHELQLMVGEDLQQVPKPDHIILRFGLRNTPKSAHMQLHINGSEVHSGELGDLLISVVKPHASTASHFVHFPIQNDHKIKVGQNKISVRIQASNESPAGASMRLMECQLGTFYEPRPHAIFEP
ncbi:hypothetical protein [Adhaeretor mobilis]|uniref:hypothetical protein n=1 Tax=Adhaeretor mobilis TaxID=1930276 RepID=UPI001C54DBED|nr:hypothetical protein [Adhaeretor mobilis]